MTTQIEITQSNHRRAVRFFWYDQGIVTVSMAVSGPEASKTHTRFSRWRTDLPFDLHSFHRLPRSPVACLTLLPSAGYRSTAPAHRAASVSARGC